MSSAGNLRSLTSASGRGQRWRRGPASYWSCPVTYALRSAEGFAAGGVSILSRLGCGFLSFGCESGDGDAIFRAAEASRSSEFEQTLHANIQTGLSYAAARQRALEALGQDGQLLTRPNDILAFEYCRAILTQNSPMHPLAVLPSRRLSRRHAGRGTSVRYGRCGG